ncbi:MAG: 2-C-methyl-D-erythritol 2,4-cyclodiphosphate synthase [Fibrobacterales bacterium]|nr:2-C-methyl-D-erythritol 2,4-cyclodiphosphate synthase [Fibrobacterales bacterium]MBP5187921.1 2-C-methyl-D-erythritol 2,4-cyclodiphosphate synthase [Fibrobacterales bacterium]
MSTRCGIGFDVHRLVEGRRCVVGGVDIPHEKGLLGHSDADVLIHAIADALLGAAGLGDIGTFFPDTDAKWEGMDSREILRFVRKRFADMGLRIVNVDSVVMAQRPKMAPHVPQMKINIAEALGIAPEAVGVKATTTEKLGFTGREEGIAAQAVASVERAP